MLLIDLVNFVVGLANLSCFIGFPCLYLILFIVSLLRTTFLIFLYLLFLEYFVNFPSL